MHSFKLLFSAISMSTTRPLSDGDAKPSELKSVKTLLLSEWLRLELGGDLQKHPFPLQKTHSKHTDTFSPCQLSVAGEKKIQEWAARWRENRRAETEEAGLSRVVFVFHTECWLTADGLLSGWSRVMRPSTLPPALPYSSRGGVTHPPNTNLWGEKDAHRICLQDCR